MQQCGGARLRLAASVGGVGGKTARAPLHGRELNVDYLVIELFHRIVDDVIGLGRAFAKPCAGRSIGVARPGLERAFVRSRADVIAGAARPGLERAFTRVRSPLGGLRKTLLTDALADRSSMDVLDSEVGIANDDVIRILR